MDISCVLDIVSREVTTVDVIGQWLHVTSGSCLLPVRPSFTIATWHEDVAVRETIEFLQVFCASLALESLDKDKVLTMLQSGVLDVFDRLEKW